MNSSEDRTHLLSENTNSSESVETKSTKTNDQSINQENDQIDNKSILNQQVLQPPQINKQLRVDNRQMNKFVAPMFGDLERIVAEQMKELDKLEEQLFGKERSQKYDNLIAHIPEAIRERKSMDAIMKNLEDLIINTTDTDQKSLDPSQKKAQETLQAKFTKSSDSTNTTNNNIPSGEKASSSDNDNSLADKLDFKSINLSNLACLSQSLCAYLVTRNSRRTGDKLKNITIKIYDSVNLWLSRLFRFDNSSVLFHDQEPDGFIRMCQIMLNCKYAEFKTNGYQAINRQPAIYLSASSRYSLPEYRDLISIQLGLPVTSIRVVTTSKVVDPNLDKIDIEAFNKQLENDLADGFVPMILLANAGSYAIGQCDDLSQLNQLAYKYRLWIHLEGVYLSSLALYSVPTEIQHVASGDSITIPLGEWLGLPNLSYVTLYKNVKNSNLYLQPFNSVLSTLQKCLPYWCVLQAVGHQGVIEKIKNATDMSYYITEIVKKHKPYLKILDYKTPTQDVHIKINSLGDLFNKALNLLTFVDLKNPIVVFKCDKAYIKERLYLLSDLNETNTKINLSNKESFKSKNLKDEFVKMLQEPEADLLYSRKLNKTDETAQKSCETNNNENNTEVKEYTDTLTTWLCDLMNSLHKNIELELIEIENEGICIRYSPLEHSNILGTNEGDLKLFDKSLEDIIAILDASIKCKSIFAKEISEFKNLIPVSIPKWAGIGAVRYIPDYLIDKLDDISKYLKYVKEKEFSSSMIESTDTDSALETDNDTSVKCESEHDSYRLSKLDETLDDKIKQTLEQDIREINEINEQLVKTLQAQDGAFSIGQAYDGLKAVKFGMVNELDVLKKLAGQVQDVGKTVEEESRYIEKMAELIRIGIEKANEDLKKENEAKLQQQGILRQIPIINDVLKWWGPSEPSIIGRTFNLQSGKIASTEVIYKYHIQVEEDAKQNKKKNSISEKETNIEVATLNSLNDNSDNISVNS